MGSVLIVDDDPSIRRLERIVLTDAGFDVIEADSGEQALAMIESEAPAILVLDLNMPEMDGREVFERLKHSGHRPRTIIVSAWASERARRQMGAEASLQKPFGPEDLVEKVYELSEPE